MVLFPLRVASQLRSVSIDGHAAASRVRRRKSAQVQDRGQKAAAQCIRLIG